MPDILHTHLDHLVITTPNLPAGIAYVEETLGVSLQPGGTHLRMGTHNYLLKLGESCYLEVIAIDPEATPPTRPRWFGLDELAADAAPALRTWVVRTSDIEAAVALAPAWFGTITPMERAQLSWLISIPDDGALPLGGICPTLLQWNTPIHPATTLMEQGCTLLNLELYHPAAAELNSVLQALGGLDTQVKCRNASARGLSAEIQTPRGLVRL